MLAHAAGSPTPSWRPCTALQVAGALLYIHSRKILHRGALLAAPISVCAQAVAGSIVVLAGGCAWVLVEGARQEPRSTAPPLPAGAPTLCVDKLCTEGWCMPLTHHTCSLVGTAQT